MLCLFKKKKNNNRTYFRQENKSGPSWPWIKMSPHAFVRSQDPLCIWPHTTDSAWGLFLSLRRHLWGLAREQCLMCLILSSPEDNEYTTSKKTVGTEGSEAMDTEIAPKPRGTKKVAIRIRVGEESSSKKEAWSREKGRWLAAGSLSRNRGRKQTWRKNHAKGRLGILLCSTWFSHFL